MPEKSNFTPDEWKLLLESVTMAGIAVSAAEPSGLWGLLKESFAEGSALLKAKMDPGADVLIKAVVADLIRCVHALNKWSLTSLGNAQTPTFTIIVVGARRAHRGEHVDHHQPRLVGGGDPLPDLIEAMISPTFTLLNSSCRTFPLGIPVAAAISFGAIGSPDSLKAARARVLIKGNWY
jgi:hypothetical protein